ncbi:MAG: radical SAM protein, partial [Halobacteriaceae archaeon]
MTDVFETDVNIPRGQFEFDHQPTTDQSFENALEKARNNQRLTIADGIELITTGTDRQGIDHHRKEKVLEVADQRRAEKVGDEVTFVANLNNNVTTACNTGCLFCNFKDRAHKFEKDYQDEHEGFTKTPQESREIVNDAVKRGIYEVCSVSGLHPGLALNDEHREALDPDNQLHNYKSPDQYSVHPGTYQSQIAAMNVDDVHIHSMTPEEAYHAKRGTDWSYEKVYRTLKQVGLDSVPGTAAEILVDEV